MERSDNFWTGDLKEFYAGKYSYATVVTNRVVQSFSQVETGKKSIFIGIYDGHSNGLAAKYLDMHLFNAIVDAVKTDKYFYEATIKECIQALEHDFMSLVRENMRTRREYMTSGSSCLMGVIFGKKLYLGNLGDSRVVIGSRYRGELRGDLVSEIHNINNEEARASFLREHPEEREGALTLAHNRYKIKGMVEVTRAIGNAYLKNPEFEIPPNQGAISLYRITGPFEKPYVGSMPFAKTIPLLPSDDFIIFATAALWDHLSMTEAAQIVSETLNERDAARNLIEKAVKNVALKRAVSYEGLIQLDREARRAFHGDITAIVVFLDHILLNRAQQECK